MHTHAMRTTTRARDAAVAARVRPGVGSAALRAVGVVLAALTVAALPCSALGAERRAYEMVSPPYKGGFGATHIEAVSKDGNTVAFFSPGAFAGAPAGLSNNANGLDYLARRGSNGWSTTPIMPPDALVPFTNHHDISVDLSTTLGLAKPGRDVEAASVEGTENEFLLHDTNTPDVNANWELAGKVLTTLTNRPTTLEYEGGSADFCHLLLLNSENGSAERYALLTQAIGAERPLYELTRGCHGEPAQLRLVAVNTKGRPISPSCASEPGLFTYDTFQANAYNAISADGSQIFFTTCIKNEPADHQLFLRLDGARTLEVSRPIDPHLEACVEPEIPCPKASERPSADFAGASEDGSKVYFTTTAALTSQDTNAENDLYMAEIGCPEGATCAASARRVTGLVQVSRNPTGGQSGVQGAVRIAPDGTRAYFIATGDLLSEAQRQALEAAGKPTPHAGADNLYVHDSASGQTSFIGDLCSGHAASGSVEDQGCPSQTGSDTRLWHGLGEHEVQSAGPDGRFLIFASYAQLTPDDSDAAKDIYRYDAVTGAITRISQGEEGYAANGNGALDANISVGHRGESVKLQHELDNRASSEDGTRVVFTSSERLSPGAINGLQNVYEWHELPGNPQGRTTLVSAGTGATPAEDPVISAEGNDIFFVTTVGLTPPDTDGEADIYDARIGGGFPAQPAPPEPCSSDACQGPLTNPAPLLVPGTVAQAPGESVAGPPTIDPKPPVTHKNHTKKRRHRVTRHGKGRKAAKRGRR